MRRLAIIHPTRNIALEFSIQGVAEMKQIGNHLVLFSLRESSQLLFDFLNAHVENTIPPVRVSQASDWALPRIGLHFLADPSERPPPTRRLE